MCRKFERKCVTICTFFMAVADSLNHLIKTAKSFFISWRRSRWCKNFEEFEIIFLRWYWRSATALRQSTIFFIMETTICSIVLNWRYEFKSCESYTNRAIHRDQELNSVWGVFATDSVKRAFFESFFGILCLKPKNLPDAGSTFRTSIFKSNKLRKLRKLHTIKITPELHNSKSAN